MLMLNSWSQKDRQKSLIVYCVKYRWKVEEDEYQWQFEWQYVTCSDSQKDTIILFT